jgi:hypothetical protein
MVNGKKIERVSVITTCISREIRFHTSQIDCINEVWKTLNKLFDKIDKSRVRQLEKELTSLEPFSLDRIEDHPTRVKEMQLKLGECGKNFLNKEGKLIELILLNL